MTKPTTPEEVAEAMIDLESKWTEISAYRASAKVLARRVRELEDGSWCCEGLNAGSFHRMKEGVTIRIGDLEADNERKDSLIASAKTLIKELGKQVANNEGMKSRIGELETAVTKLSRAVKLLGELAMLDGLVWGDGTPVDRVVKLLGELAMLDGGRAVEKGRIRT